MAEREPPRAFRGASESLLQAAIVGIANKLFNLAKPRFTSQELLDLFVEPRYHETLSNAFALTEGCGQQQNLYIDLLPRSNERYSVSGRLQFAWYHSTVPDGFFPIRMGGGHVDHPLNEARETWPKKTTEKFDETLRRMIDISFEWGLVLTVFNGLNTPGYCSTPAQMRYVWPSVLQLALETGNDELAASLQNVSIRAGDKARIPTNIRHYVRETYDIVTKSIFLIEHQAENRTANGISYFLHRPMFTVNGLTFEGLA
jgi:hypothetical protein